MAVARREPRRRFRVARGEAGVECDAAETGVQGAAASALCLCVLYGIWIAMFITWRTSPRAS